MWSVLLGRVTAREAYGIFSYSLRMLIFFNFLACLSGPQLQKCALSTALQQYRQNGERLNRKNSEGRKKVTAARNDDSAVLWLLLLGRIVGLNFKITNPLDQIFLSAQKMKIHFDECCFRQ